MPLGQALHALHVIDDQAPPPHTTEGRVAPEELLIGCDADVEAVGLGPPLPHTQQGIGVSSPTGSPQLARTPPTITPLVLSDLLVTAQKRAECLFLSPLPPGATALVWTK